MGTSESKSVPKSINLRQTVKSEYFIKEIFSFLCEKKKLNIISYNKAYQ